MKYDLCVKFTKNKTCIKKITLKLSKKSLKYLSGLTPGLSPFLSFKLSSAQGLSYFQFVGGGFFYKTNILLQVNINRF